MIAIIGGGLAGTSLAQYLGKYRHDFRWFLDDVPSASHISSGIINPVSGRKFSMSWKYEVLRNIAVDFYGDFLRPIEIEKYFSAHDGLITIEDVTRGKENYLSKIDNQNILVRDSFQLDVTGFIASIQASFQYQIIRQKFLHSELDFHQGIWMYQGMEFQQVIFAEGIAVLDNPYFNYIDFRPNRGEALILDILNYNLQTVKKHGKFICKHKGQFWVGSSFDKVDRDAPRTTEKERSAMEEAMIHLTSQAEYQVLSHLGAFRSTTYDRRPIIGEHPLLKGLYIFNGFGTKGASLIPYCTIQVMERIFGGKEVENEISIKRLKA